MVSVCHGSYALLNVICVFHELQYMRVQKKHQITVRLPAKLIEEIDELSNVHQTDRTTEILRACEIYVEQVKDIDSEEIQKYYDYRKEKAKIFDLIGKMSKKIEALEKEVEDLKRN